MEQIFPLPHFPSSIFSRPVVWCRFGQPWRLQNNLGGNALKTLQLLDAADWSAVQDNIAVDCQWSMPETICDYTSQCLCGISCRNEMKCATGDAIAPQPTLDVFVECQTAI